jgi:glycosyltransferase involved in cell wall biosynthesis
MNYSMADLLGPGWRPPADWPQPELTEPTLVEAALAETVAAAAQTAPVQRSCYYLGPKRTCCDHLYICRETAGTDCVLEGELLGARSCQTCELRIDPHCTIDVVIPCHNYERFLPDCLQSILDSTVRPANVIIVDDASDKPVEVPHGFLDLKIKLIRVEHRSQALACKSGFEHVVSKYVSFLDADDKISKKYLSSAIRRIETDRNIAGAYPHLITFGDTEGLPAHGMDKAPDVVRLANLEKRNWCPAGTIWRSEVVRQSRALADPRVPGCMTNDWITARTILRSGPWHIVAANAQINYRIHAGQMHSQSDFHDYTKQANLTREVVTIIIAFSGRFDIWPKLRDWLQRSTWPVEQTRLMILNSTHKPLSLTQLGLGDYSGSIQIERIDVGEPGLADVDRRNALMVGRKVEAAVTGLYNQAVQMAVGEWLFFLEDDVIPHSPDAISVLMHQTHPSIAAISGLYPHRYEQSAVAFKSLNPLYLHKMAGEGTEDVYGSGFGCLLIRRSVLSTTGLSGDSVTDPFYDVDIGRRVTEAGWRWLLDRSVTCDHLFKEPG